MVYKWLNNALLLILGHLCLLCQRRINGQHVDFCRHCHRDLPVIRHACQQCGRSLESKNLSHCGRCLTHPPNFDRVISAYAYASPIRQLMAQFKFQQQLSLAPVFARALLAQIKQADSRIEAILPVPLHALRLRQRGFNQASELAQTLAHRLRKPVMLKSIRRKRNTETQSSLPAKQRVKNLRGAFECIEPLRYKGVAIIDDVMTTGSTANELAKLLKQNGVEYVEVWCVARAEIHNRR